MPWKVERNSELGAIELRFTGRINRVEIWDSTAEALSIASGPGRHLFLSDFSDATLELSALDIYNIPDQWEAAGAERKNRVAVVTPQDSVNFEDSKFYENVTTNRGWNVRVFEDRESAIEWLKKD
ncbi:MAG: hypothetical protein GF417_05960 [Candidatus Latescibacteria bacterium]|nr:hypothetical protein [bacterium]MBD3423962.1 hypothetical protein [Candidatus Latescibacterota bacterium]